MIDKSDASVDDRLKVFERIFTAGAPDTLAVAYDFARDHGADEFVSSARIDGSDYGMYSNSKNSIAKLGVSTYKIPVGRDVVNVKQYLSGFSPEFTSKVTSFGSLNLVSTMKEFLEGDVGYVPQREMRRTPIISHDGDMLYWDRENDRDVLRSVVEDRMSFLGQSPVAVTEIPLPFTVPSAVIVRSRSRTMSKKFNVVDIEQFSGDKDLNLYVNDGVDDLVGFLMASPEALSRIYDLFQRNKNSVVNFAGDRIYVSTPIMKTGFSLSANPESEYGAFVEALESQLDFVKSSASSLVRSARPSRVYPPDVDEYLTAWGKAGNIIVYKFIAVAVAVAAAAMVLFGFIPMFFF